MTTNKETDLMSSGRSIAYFTMELALEPGMPTL